MNDPSLCLQSTTRKVKARIIPFLLILYVVAFLDRINIGFAALTMNNELGISSREFGLLSGVFFLGYFVFEIPSNLLLHRFGARVWIARIMVTWGIVALLTGLAQSVTHLYALRFLLGVAEAGFFPGIILYLTYWFPRSDRARAVAIFMTAIPASNILGAPLSGWMLDHVHWFAISSWRWLIILQAVPAVVFGILTYYFLPSRPAEAKFLHPDEISSLEAELRAEEIQKQEIHTVSAMRALGRGRVWQLAAIYMALNTAMYAITFWMPQLVKSLSATYSNTVVGILMVAPYAAGMFMMIAISRHSDHALERRYHAAFPAIAGALALLGIAFTDSALVSMVALAVVVAGIYSFYGPFWALPGEFLTGAAAASGIALINSVGNLGGFLGPYALGAIMHRTGSLHMGLAAAGTSLILAATIMLALPERKSGLARQVHTSAFG